MLEGGARLGTLGNPNPRDGEMVLSIFWGEAGGPGLLPQGVHRVRLVGACVEWEVQPRRPDQSPGGHLGCLVLTWTPWDPQRALCCHPVPLRPEHPQPFVRACQGTDVPPLAVHGGLCGRRAAPRGARTSTGPPPAPGPASRPVTALHSPSTPFWVPRPRHLGCTSVPWGPPPSRSPRSGGGGHGSDPPAASVSRADGPALTGSRVPGHGRGAEWGPPGPPGGSRVVGGTRLPQGRPRAPWGHPPPRWRPSHGGAALQPAGPRRKQAHTALPRAQPPALWVPGEWGASALAHESGKKGSSSLDPTAYAWAHGVLNPPFLRKEEWTEPAAWIPAPTPAPSGGCLRCAPGCVHLPPASRTSRRRRHTCSAATRTARAWLAWLSSRHS